ncbi:MAG: energy transducer TonB [Taibaiella sp.]|jgi:protein TonB
MHKLILVTILIACSFSTFAQSEQSKTSENVPGTEIMVEGDKIYSSPDQLAEFPGGLQGLQEYMNSALQYPKKAIKRNIEGKVFVQFVVSKSGKVVNVELKRDIGGGCGDEACRLVRGMPDWKPGTIKGVPVNLYYTLPITFSLN